MLAWVGPTHEKGLPSRVGNIPLGKAGAASQVEGRCPPAQMAFPQLLLTSFWC